MIVKLLDGGMDVARLNFSHGDHKVMARLTIHVNGFSLLTWLILKLSLYRSMVSALIESEKP